MLKVEKMPIPSRYDDSMTAGLEKLESETDSIWIRNANIRSIYAIASRLGIRVITRAEGEGIRVWRNFKEKPKKLTKQDRLAGFA